jgi:hypothetical protein
MSSWIRSTPAYCPIYVSKVTREIGISDAPHRSSDKEYTARDLATEETQAILMILTATYSLHIFVCEVVCCFSIRFVGHRTFLASPLACYFQARWTQPLRDH